MIYRLTQCSGPAPGGNVIYDSPDDTLNAVPDLLNHGSGNTFPSFDEGGSIYPNGVDRNPGAILNLTPHPQSGLNPGTYPVDPKTCQPIQPWDYLKVNSIFGVIAVSSRALSVRRGCRSCGYRRLIPAGS